MTLKPRHLWLAFAAGIAVGLYWNWDWLWETLR